MKILKIQATGLKLFNGTLEIDFYAKQRVSSDKNEMLTNIDSNFYINNVISLAGINASGKTTTLKVILFVLQLLDCKPINSMKYNYILEGLSENEFVEFNIFLISENGKLSKLKTIIKSEISPNELDRRYYIANEIIYSKPISSVRSKKELFDFSGIEPEIERKNDEPYLLGDVSIMIAYNKINEASLFVMDSMEDTDFSCLRVLGNFPLELVRFLDSSIEYLKCKTYENQAKIEICLKFYNREEIILYNPLQLNRYLSSGTVKGLNIFMMAMVILNEGGYLIIDELENHFNKEIVATLIRFFMDSEINKNGAVLIFSTHYVELLDIFQRNDNVYILKNINGIQVINLSDILKRNDGKKKSELFQSGYIDNTTPDYDAYINLKHIMSNVRINKEIQNYEW